MRTVLVHYHIFKNSGTSFDHVLRRHLGSALMTFEAPEGKNLLLQDDLARIICENGQCRGFTSHTICLPVPRIEDVEVLSVVFLRHPLLRLKSVYSFLRQRTLRSRLRTLVGKSTRTDRSPITQLARSCASFEEWLEQLVNRPECRDYIANTQTRFLSGGYNRRPRQFRTGSNAVLHYDLEAAKDNLSAVSLLGRTEHFDTDLANFAPRLRDSGFQLDLDSVKPRNVTDWSFRQPTAERVKALEERLGSELSSTAWELLDQDLQLYNWVNAKLSAA